MKNAMNSDNTSAEGVTDPSALKLPTIDEDFDNSYTISQPWSKTVDDAREEAKELMRDIRNLAAQNGWVASRIKTGEGKKIKRKESGIPAPVKRTSPRKAVPKFKSALEPAASVSRKMNPVDIGSAQERSVRFESLGHDKLNITTRFSNKDVPQDPSTNMLEVTDTKRGPTTPSSRRSRNTPSLFKDTSTFIVTPPTPNTSPLRRKSSSTSLQLLGKDTNTLRSLDLLTPPFQRRNENKELRKTVDTAQQDSFWRSKSLPADIEQIPNEDSHMPNYDATFAVMTRVSLSQVLSAIQIRNKGLDQLDRKALDVFLSDEDTEHQPASSRPKLNRTRVTKKQNAENHPLIGTPPETTASMEADMDLIRASIRHSLRPDAFRRSQVPKTGFLASQSTPPDRKLISQIKGDTPASLKEAADLAALVPHRTSAVGNSVNSMRVDRKIFLSQENYGPLTRGTTSVRQIYNSTNYGSPISSKLGESPALPPKSLSKNSRSELMKVPNWARRSLFDATPESSPSSTPVKIKPRGVHKSLLHSELNKQEPITLDGIGIPTQLSSPRVGNESNESVKFIDAYDIAQQVKELHAQDKHLHPPVKPNDHP